MPDRAPETEGYHFMKPAVAENDNAAPEKPKIHQFIPSKEHYDDPRELAEEFRTFVAEDLKDGEQVHVSDKHARMMAASLSAPQKGAPGEDGDEAEDITETERIMASLDREEVAEVLASSAGIVVMGVLA